MPRDPNLSIDTTITKRVDNNPAPVVDEESEEDDLSPSPVIDENIDFSLVYALHNFKATVEGQITVIKGDSLTLLDDSNSYWWLVKIMRNDDIGYIPAENIETPYERLARLNKSKNVILSSSHNNTEEDNSDIMSKKYQRGRKIVYFTSPEFIDTTTKEEPVEDNQSITISTTASTQVDGNDQQNGDSNIVMEPTNLTEQNMQQDINKSNEQYDYIDQRSTTPTARIFKNLFKRKKKPKQTKQQSTSNSRKRSDSQSLQTQQNQIQPEKITREYHVVRVFAGRNLSTNFDSKIVLLSEATNTTSLIKQAIRRFKLNDENFDNYYISIKEINKEEKSLMSNHYPLKIFMSSMSSYSTTLPSVKRSSVSSNLSNISSDESI
ncbi:1856_t:CDS:2, partial [Scutellospora calospora]